LFKLSFQDRWRKRKEIVEEG